MTLALRGGYRPGPAAIEALHEGVVGVDVPPPVLAAIPAHHRERGRPGLQGPIAAREHPCPARAVQHPTRLDLHALPATQHDLDPPPLPIARPLRQPGHPVHDGRPGPRRRLTQERIEPRPQDMEPGGAPREVVAAPLAAPQRGVPPVRVETPRLHHPEQARRGEHLARAGGQRLGQGLVCRPLGRVGRLLRAGRGVPGCGALDHQDFVAPCRKKPGRRRSRRTATEDQNVWVRVHPLMCRHREPRVSRLTPILFRHSSNLVRNPRLARRPVAPQVLHQHGKGRHRDSVFSVTVDSVGWTGQSCGLRT